MRLPLRARWRGKGAQSLERLYIYEQLVCMCTPLICEKIMRTVSEHGNQATQLPAPWPCGLQGSRVGARAWQGVRLWSATQRIQSGNRTGPERERPPRNPKSVVGGCHKSNPMATSKCLAPSPVCDATLGWIWIVNKLEVDTQSEQFLNDHYMQNHCCHTREHS